ncbi:cysteine desulfurase [bacterium]|nr:cysteine desulfurase [candidate division CSSED10-310 bacterium]
MKPIYLDYNATTPLDPQVVEAMLPFIHEHFGNPSSSHVYGRRAARAVDLARLQTAALLNCAGEEIVFTGGGSESNNHAIRGAAFANRDRGDHVITSAIEHPAVMEVCRFLETIGFRVTYIGVDGQGLVDVAEVARAVTPRTILISIMHANNEVGTIQPIAEIAGIARRHGVLVHTDAAQSAGKIPTDVQAMGVDLLSVAAHKLYAPKGVGALFVRRGVRLEKLIHGAAHEGNRRAGTENVAGIVGLGKACELCGIDREAHAARLGMLRDRLHAGLREIAPPPRLNGHPELRLPNTLSLGFPGVRADALLRRLTGVAVSAGAACHSGAVEMSATLRAMDVPVEYAMGTIRFSIGRFTTEAEIDRAIHEIAAVLAGAENSQDR